MQNRLSKIRENLGYTQEEFAKIIGVERPTLSNWEINRFDIPLNHLINISNKYNYSIDYILCLSDKNIAYTKLEKIDKQVLRNNLKTLRDNKHITQKEICLITGTCSDTYSRYERGASTITSISLYCICKEYNISMDEILGRTHLDVANAK